MPWKLNPAETGVCTFRHLDRASKTGNRDYAACTAVGSIHVEYVLTNFTCVSGVCFPFSLLFQGWECGEIRSDARWRNRFGTARSKEGY